MESKWYFFPGQSTENTKISDRAHALHITKAAWGGITQHLDRKKRVQEAIEKEEAHKRALKEGSEAMTSEWKDSIENIRLTKEKERAERLGKKGDKIEMFYKMRAEQDAVRKEIVAAIRKRTFISSGYPKDLTSALILSETLYERDKQVEFNEQIRKREEEIHKNLEQAIIDRDNRERQEDADQKKQRREKDEMVAKALMDQITERKTARDAAYKMHIEKEALDRMNATKEEEIIKKYNEEEKRRKLRENRKEKQEEIEAERRRQQQLKKEDEEFEKAVEFYSNAKHRIECMMKQKEKEMRAADIKAREELALRVSQASEDKEGIQNRITAKAVAEKEEAERVRQQARKDLQELGKKIRNEGRQQYLDKLAEEKRIEDELKRWEMLNRIKTYEAMEEYNEENRKTRWAKILEFRNGILEQMAEREETRKFEKEIDEMLSHVSFVETDKMFFNYANEVLDYAKTKNRTTYPIEKVIKAYKKANNIDQERANPRYCKHFPEFH